MSAEALELRVPKNSEIKDMFELYKRTMYGSVMSDTREWNDDHAWDRMGAYASSGRARLLHRASGPIGMLVVSSKETSMQLELICITPELQRRGLGTQLVRGIQDEAHRLLLPVRLKLPYSAYTGRLFHRLGFFVIESLNQGVVMEWTPSPHGASADPQT
jgi:GNAT superfamily N-acetyltransferase